MLIYCQQVMFVIQVSEDLMKGNDDYEMNDENGMMDERKYTTAKDMAVERRGDEIISFIIERKDIQAQHISIF